MADKPKHASEYQREQVELVRATCLYVATKLGDLMDDLVIVGGLVPSLIVDQSALPEDVDAHVGTMDLDLGLQLHIVRNFGAGVEDVVAKLQPLLDDEEARKALDVLRSDFTDPEGFGPMRVAEFITGSPDDEIQADVVGFVTALLDR